MIDDPVRRWLVEGGPPPSEIHDLLDVEPPPELIAATLAAVEAERAAESLPALQPANDRRRWLAGLTLASGLAAAVLVSLWPAHPVGDPANMVARGDGSSLPSVDLKMAVEHQGQLERLREGRYPPGDKLFFRVASDGPGWATLIRVDSAGVELLDQREVAAGEADLSLDGRPLAWTLEAGDPSSVFALLGSEAPLDPDALDALLRTQVEGGHAEDADAICTVAAQAGLRCDAAWVGVEP